MTGHTHLADWEHSGVVGGIPARGKEGMRNVAFSFMLCQVVF